VEGVITSASTTGEVALLGVTVRRIFLRLCFSGGDWGYPAVLLLGYLKLQYSSLEQSQSIPSGINIYEAHHYEKPLYL
jgi:hypothetical protein